MSRAKKCDRCGAFYEENARIKVKRNGETFIDGLNTTTSNGFTYKSYDLCDECVDDLMHFLTGTPLVGKIIEKEVR